MFGCVKIFNRKKDIEIKLVTQKTTGSESSMSYKFIEEYESVIVVGSSANDGGSYINFSSTANMVQLSNLGTYDGARRQGNQKVVKLNNVKIGDTISANTRHEGGMSIFAVVEKETPGTVVARARALVLNTLRLISKPLKNMMVNAMFGRVHTNQKNFFPAGYKLKTGALISKRISNGDSVLNIPSNVIPLTVKIKVNPQYSGGNNPGFNIQDNNGVVLASGSSDIPRENNSHNANIPAIDLMSLNGYDFNRMKTINQIKWINIYYSAALNADVTIISWLEKTGGNS
ncbi:hypothetical protein [Anaerorhabdus sp.]|uniref:hypothetical protein n=1 Tax=Anaerorhabdus sp. TaxID=1872524 RepID=UPI002FCB1E73